MKLITISLVIMMAVSVCFSAVNQLPNTEDITVYQKENVFAGWPANGGAWTWDDDEMLVSFTIGGMVVQKGHNIDKNLTNVLCRSKDGGKTWQKVDATNFTSEEHEIKELKKPIDFNNKDFALKFAGTGYHAHRFSEGVLYYTYDRGDTWQGPYAISGLAGNKRLKKIVNANTDKWETRGKFRKGWKGFELTPRTDYIVKSGSEALVFMGVRPGNRGNFVDRLFCARTTDGGMNFEFVSWIVRPADPARAVMSQTVSVDDDEMVSAIRRRIGERCWVDAYGTTDGGKNWSFLNRVGNTGTFNGNPPALIKLDDGRLCCVFGNRTERAIMVSYSSDKGKTWTEPAAIRSGDYKGKNDDDPDLGYPRLLQRKDGNLVAIYYWSTKKLPHHIAATIWKP